MRTLVGILAWVGLCATVCTAQSSGAASRAETTPSAWDVEFDETLPDVLLLGDSISMGYTPFVREALEGKANVARAVRPRNRRMINCGSTEAGLEGIDAWLGERDWDVIHFNWGLHDLCYRNPNSKTQGNRDKENGTIAVPLDEYEENLEKLVQRLKETGATLIWANTTVVPEGEEGRFVGDDAKYNQVAASIMRKYEIPINDLNSVTQGFAPELWKAPANVHFAPAGYEALGRRVARVILRQLSD